MKVSVSVQIDGVDTLLKKRGLEPGGRIQKLFTARCAAEMDPYVPMQQGTLKNIHIIDDDSVTYNTPYARFHYYGKVMVGITSRSAYAKAGERKEVTAKDIKHHGAPKRGPFWDRRMWADKKTKIVSDIAKAAGGKPG
jgi:hypothetical protein